MKYPWSPTIYAVTFWPSNPLWGWKKLDYRLWERAGYPVPRDAGWIYGTAFWKRAGSPAVYADAPDGTTHELTYAEWAAAGYPKPETR